MNLKTSVFRCWYSIKTFSNVCWIRWIVCVYYSFGRFKRFIKHAKSLRNTKLRHWANNNWETHNAYALRLFIKMIRKSKPRILEQNENSIKTELTTYWKEEQLQKNRMEQSANQGKNIEFFIRSIRLNLYNSIKSSLIELSVQIRIIRSLLFWIVPGQCQTANRSSSDGFCGSAEVHL